MYIDLKKILSVLALLVIGAVIGITGVKIVERYQEPKQTVSIVGTGEIDATTDQANITVQIKTVSTTFEKAQEQNKKDVDSLKSELTKLGIPESRITVSSYSSPIFRGLESEVNTMEIQENKMIARPPIYNSPTVITDLILTLDPIKNIEKIYDLISKNSGAQVTSTYYSLKNQKVWESKAKEEALKDTRSQIESIAKINHLKVGKLLSLEDTNNPQPYPMPMEATINESNGMMKDFQTDSNIQEALPAESKNVYYNEQSVKITASYTATYELY